MAQIKYPVGIQSFEKLRKNGFLYVDKTELIYKLVTGNEYYFLSRPRRFGKSLMLSTLEALFEGKRELFKGLAIDSLEWEWEKYPVIHLDFNGELYSSKGALSLFLDASVRKLERKSGIENPYGSISMRFRDVIERLHVASGKPVVILIDEYDKPLLDTLHDDDAKEGNRELLQAFYSVLKTMDRHIRFVMLTGVSRFGKVSVFSGMNNLSDISLLPRYNAICGITEKELLDYFEEGMHEMAEIEGSTPEKIHAELKRNYDGYHFSKVMEDVYNPFSLLNTFDKHDFGYYWFNSGTPTFLVHLLEKSHFSLPEIDGYRCKESLLAGSDVYLTDPIPIFFQSGYLTIKGYDPDFKEYILGFPNMEVSEGFSEFLMKSYMHSQSSSFPLSDLVGDVRTGNAQGFMERLQSFFADFPNDQIREREVHFQNVLYLVMKLMGVYVRTEYKTSDGRVDLVIETDRYIYVIELKLKGTAKEALRQIKAKEYYLPFKNSGKKIILIGAAFSVKTRRLNSWLIE